MKISELHVTGFRSLKDVTWKPGDLNVVIGPNASGKSNLLRALEMLREAAKGQLVDYVQSGGGYLPLRWNGEAENIELTINWASNQPGDFLTAASYQLGTSLHPTMGFGVSKEDLRAHLNLGPSPVQSREKMPPFIQRSRHAAALYDDTQTVIDVTGKNLSPQETLLASSSGLFSPSSVPRYVSELIGKAGIYPNLDTGKQAKIRQIFGVEVAKKIDPELENFSGVLHTLYTNDGEFKEAIDDGMKAAFDEYVELKFPPAAQDRIQLGLKWKSLKGVQSATVLSDGTLKLLMLLTILADPEPPSLIAIEEPEAGLHPRLFAIVAEYAAAAAHKCQVVFTTHSPPFLDAFREQTPTVTVARLEDGQTQLNTLDGNELKHWLDDFSLGSMFKSGELEAMA